LIAAPAVSPAAAEVMTCAWMLARLPATHTPGTLVAPDSSASICVPTICPPRRTSVGTRPSGASNDQSVQADAGTVVEGDPGQSTGICVDVGDCALDDRNAECRELFALLVAHFGGGVGQDGNVLAELAEQQRLMHRACASGEDADALVPYFPPVAVGAVQYIDAPPISQARHIR
jgi:hypothetical protein